MLRILFLFVALCAWPGNLPAAETGTPAPPPETILRTYYPLPDQVSLCGDRSPFAGP